MFSIRNRSDSDRICIINADMDKGMSDVVDSRSREVAHEFDGHVGAFTCACIYKKRIERWRGSGKSRIRGVMTQVLIEGRHATFEDRAG